MADIKPRGGLKPGVTVKIGGAEYVAPQLNFGALREMRTLDVKSRTYSDDLMAFVLLKSLERNYENVDAIWLNQTFDGSELDDAGVAILEIMKASGLRAPEGESSGEAPAATV